MTRNTKNFILIIMRSILDNEIKHDCRQTNPDGICTWCTKAQETIAELNNTEKK